MTATSAGGPPNEASRRPPTRRPPRRRFLPWSPLTQRILAVNVLALGMLVAGILYQDEYKKGLVQSELTALETQADMFAVALAEGAVASRSPSAKELLRDTANQMVRRLVASTGARARLFNPDGVLVADSRVMAGTRGVVQIDILPPPETGVAGRVMGIYDRLSTRFSWDAPLEAYHETATQTAVDYAETALALHGGRGRVVRQGRDRLILSVAVPVQRYKQVLGALMLSKTSRDLDVALLEVRLDILTVFGVTLALTVLLSLYQAGTIARPIRRLAHAADRLRGNLNRQDEIPDMSNRGDEIGDLASALRDMTAALWSRMDAIEQFAADVSHELKNPLTSLRSAVETVARVDDAASRARLMAIIQDDVVRLDRLISDISDASRVDAEMSRGELGAADLRAMLETIVGINETLAGPAGRPRLTLKAPAPAHVRGIDTRLAQVFRNLIDNALSFSPPHGTIAVTLQTQGKEAVVHIDDDGPGIPEGAEKRIFERFYSERPEGEKFGTHSGLGLSISKQIIEAHGGTITAGNRTDQDGRGRGARFTVRLALA